MNVDRIAARDFYSEPMTLASDVDAFYLEHRQCGELENRSPEDGSRVVLMCECGAALNRPAGTEREH